MQEPDDPEIIFGHCKYATKQEILAAVPPRPIVDRLVAGFFSYESMAPGLSSSQLVFVYGTDLISCRP
jgi:hypothetical protein